MDLQVRRPASKRRISPDPAPNAHLPPHHAQTWHGRDQTPTAGLLIDHANTATNPTTSLTTSLTSHPEPAAKRMRWLPGPPEPGFSPSPHRAAHHRDDTSASAWPQHTATAHQPPHPATEHQPGLSLSPLALSPPYPMSPGSRPTFRVGRDSAFRFGTAAPAAAVGLRHPQPHPRRTAQHRDYSSASAQPQLTATTHHLAAQQPHDRLAAALQAARAHPSALRGLMEASGGGFPQYFDRAQVPFIAVTYSELATLRETASYDSAQRQPASTTLALLQSASQLTFLLCDASDAWLAPPLSPGLCTFLDAIGSMWTVVLHAISQSQVTHPMTHPMTQLLGEAWVVLCQFDAELTLIGAFALRRVIAQLGAMAKC